MGFASDVIMKKTRETKKKLYGDPNYVNHDKAIKTNLERYGVETNLQLESIKEQNRQYFFRKQNELNEYGFIPNYNPKTCEYFNDLMEQTDIFIQHAETVEK